MTRWQATKKSKMVYLKSEIDALSIQQASSERIKIQLAVHTNIGNGVEQIFQFFIHTNKDNHPPPPNLYTHTKTHIEIPTTLACESRSIKSWPQHNKYDVEKN